MIDLGHSLVSYQKKNMIDLGQGLEQSPLFSSLVKYPFSLFSIQTRDDYVPKFIQFVVKF